MAERLAPSGERLAPSEGRPSRRLGAAKHTEPLGKEKHRGGNPGRKSTPASHRRRHQGASRHRGASGLGTEPPEHSRFGRCHRRNTVISEEQGELMPSRSRPSHRLAAPSFQLFAPWETDVVLGDTAATTSILGAQSSDPPKARSGRACRRQGARRSERTQCGQCGRVSAHSAARARSAEVRTQE